MTYNAMMDTDVKIFEKRCYELYQLDWMKTHGYSLQDAFNVLREGYAEGCMSRDINGGTCCDDDFDVIEKYFAEQGFNGELYNCFDEFIECDFKDELYMKYLLDSESFDFWKSYN